MVKKKTSKKKTAAKITGAKITAVKKPAENKEPELKVEPALKPEPVPEKEKLLIIDEEKRDGKIVYVATGTGKEIVMETSEQVDAFIEKIKGEIKISDRRTIGW